MSSSGSMRQRPLSPHLTIYKPIPTMVMSILHRITGVALYVGTLLVAWWLLAAASGPSAFETASGFFGSWFGRLVLLGYTWALLFHMFGGIRHLIWDTGKALEKETTTSLAWVTLASSILATLLVWIAGYMVR